MMTLQEAQKRIAALQARYATPPSYGEFIEEWSHMDELSKSLILFDVSAKEHAGDKYAATVGGYLKQMGVETEPPFSLEELAGRLESDPL